MNFTPAHLHKNEAEPCDIFFRREWHYSLNDGGCGAKYILFSKVLRFGFAVRIPQNKKNVCGLLRSAGLARAPAASRRERARGAERTASKAWPITENFTRKQIQIVSRVSESGAEMNFTPAHSTYFHTKVLSYRKENSIFVLRKNVCL